jgi:hypothetical protein
LSRTGALRCVLRTARRLRAGNLAIGRSNQIGAHAECGRGLGEAPVQSANRGALLHRDRDMECVARPKPNAILIGESRGGAKMAACDRQDRQGLIPESRNKAAALVRSSTLK